MARVGVILNPLSGHGSAAHLSRWLRKRLRDEVEVIEIRAETDIAAWARERAQEGCERILVVGGDGTFRSVASALIGLDVALGLVATGTNNNISRALGLPVDPYEATEVALAEDSEWITAGRVNGYIFFEEASIGLEAQLWPVGEAFVRHRVREILEAPVALATNEPTAVTIELTYPDYGDTVAASTMSISNIAVTGAHLPIAPGHDIREPDLWLTVYHEMGPIGMLRTIGDLMHHQPVPAQFVSRHPFKHAKISASDPLPVCADGTKIGTLPIEVEAIPHAVRVVFPQKAGAGPVAAPLTVGVVA
jgi:diacylglycerol kinase (ATP)